MKESEQQLINEAVTGNQDALSALLARFGPKLREYLRGKIDSRWNSVLSDDDVMQETYADAFLSIHQFQPQGQTSFLRWLMQLTKNNLVDAIRGLSAARRGGRRADVTRATQSDSYVELYEQLAGSSTSPSTAAAREEAKRALDKFIPQLPDPYREVICLYDLGGCSVADVCEACHCSEGAMFMRRARAHRLLRELLDHSFF